MRVTEIIEVKGPEVVSLPPGATVQEMVDTLQARRIGAVVVVEGEDLVGIVSERDVVRFAGEGGNFTTPLSEVMTTEVITCKPTDRAKDLAQVMTDKRIRHLPVVDDGELAGLVSIGDIVRARLEELEAERDHLVDYVQS